MDVSNIVLLSINTLLHYSVINSIGLKLSLGLGGGNLLWVSESWVSEFTIVIFGQELLFDGSGDSKEVGKVNGVRDVGVEVIFEVLEHVHVLFNEVVSSDSWEGEGLIQKIPGVNLNWWWVSVLLGKSILKVKNISPVSLIEGS